MEIPAFSGHTIVSIGLSEESVSSCSREFRECSSDLYEFIKATKHVHNVETMCRVSDYIESFYNRTRRHSYLGGVGPEGFEAATTQHRKRVH